MGSIGGSGFRVYGRLKAFGEGVRLPGVVSSKDQPEARKVQYGSCRSFVIISTILL